VKFKCVSQVQGRHVVTHCCVERDRASTVRRSVARLTVASCLKFLADRHASPLALLTLPNFACPEILAHHAYCGSTRMMPQENRSRTIPSVVRRCESAQQPLLYSSRSARGATGARHHGMRADNAWQRRIVLDTHLPIRGGGSLAFWLCGGLPERDFAGCEPWRRHSVLYRGMDAVHRDVAQEKAPPSKRLRRCYVDTAVLRRGSSASGH
jgi:hypothetical protein